MLSTILNKYHNSNLDLISISLFLVFLFPISIITGPFLPDLIMTLLAIIGLILFFLKKIKVVFYKEIIFLWVFYIFLIISSLSSPNIYYSFDYSLFYFRFILFAHYFLILLLDYPKTKKFFLLGITVSLSLICIYSFFQILHKYFLINELDGVRRLKLLFSDEEIVGSFVIRILPILFFLIYYEKKKFKKYTHKLFYILLIISSLIVILYSGERTAVLLLILLILLIVLIFFRVNKKLSIILFVSLTSFIFFFVINNDHIKDRLSQDFHRNLSQDIEINPYFSYGIVSLKMFHDNPILGLGPKMFRYYCAIFVQENKQGQCNLHPHNTYLQLLGETGVFGFLFVSLIFSLVFYKYLRGIFSSRNNFCYLFACLGFIINFFPFVPSGNFFNNWLNSLYYMSIIVLIFSLKVKTQLNSNDNF